jgi:hypothetical protein
VVDDQVVMAAASPLPFCRAGSQEDLQKLRTQRRSVGNTTVKANTIPAVARKEITS